MAPGFIFLIVMSFEILFNRIKSVKYKKIKYIVTLGIMILMLTTSLAYITNIEDNPDAINEVKAAQWMEDKDGIIYSNRGAIYTWLLQKEVKNPRYMDNNTILNQELVDGNATYYISMGNRYLHDYKLIKEIGNVKILRLA